MVTTPRYTAKQFKPLTTLDTVFDVTDSSTAPQDFAFIFHFAQPPTIERLRVGANSATKLFPTSGARINKGQWVFSDDPQRIQTPIATDDCERKRIIESFINKPFSPRDDAPVKQLFLNSTLVTRFHHTATDGLGAALWLGHQLNVAFGLVGPVAGPAQAAPLTLRSLPSSVRRSRFAYAEACDPLWSPGAKRSGIRQWLTFGFRSSVLRDACRLARGFTYNDLLSTCTLEVFKKWNQTRRPGTTQRIGLWLPMNVRQHPFTGFGNGTSRVRLYACYPDDASVLDKAREIRRQLSWSTENGEWVVPELPVLKRLPKRISSKLVQLYLSLPSVDMTTGIFSHADSAIADSREAFKNIERIECVGLMHPRQRIALNGTTQGGCTWLTFTYDSGLFTEEEIRELSVLYTNQLKLASSELFGVPPSGGQETTFKRTGWDVVSDFIVLGSKANMHTKFQNEF